MSYDKESLLRFVNATLNGEAADQCDVDAVAEALFDLFCGADLRRELGLVRKPGQRGAACDMDRVTIDSPEFGIALKYVAKRCQHKDAVAAMVDLTKKEEKTAEKYLKQLRDRAQRAHELRLWLKSVSTKDKS